MKKAILFFDGASSPKRLYPASWGYTLIFPEEEREQNKNIKEKNIEGQGICRPVYPQTNNTAEYFALLHGLNRALLEGVTDIEIKGDSQLVIYQVTGKYKVKEPHLKILHEAARSLLSKFSSFTVSWIPESENIADGVSRVKGESAKRESAKREREEGAGTASGEEKENNTEIHRTEKKNGKVK